MSAYRGMSMLLAVVTAALGVILIAVTLWHGGGEIGLLLGGLFLLAGGGRLYLIRRTG